LKDLQRYDEAEKEYREAIKINPNLAVAHYNLGVLLKDLQRYDEAEKEYREAIRLNPNHAKAHVSLGLLYIEVGKKGKAREKILKARELFEKQGEYTMVEFCDETLKNL
jgi:tetratricopeptide (TPR) repeat protein